MTKVTSVLQPGQAALFVFARHVTGDKVASALVPFGGTVIRANLNTADEQKLRDALSKVQVQVASTLPAASKA